MNNYPYEYPEDLEDPEDPEDPEEYTPDYYLPDIDW